MTEIRCDWDGCPTYVQRTTGGTVADGLIAHLMTELTLSDAMSAVQLHRTVRA